MKVRYCLGLVLLFVVSTASAQQQIPNGSFEVWGSDGNPEGWTTNNQPPFVEMITKSSDHSDGSFSAHGEVLEFIPGQTAPPLMYTGTGQAAGFPYGARPATLNGFLATDLKGGDVFFINVVFTKAAEPVAGATLTLTTSSPELQSFSLPIMYVNELMPDTAMIMVMIMNEASSSPTAGSNFTIDGLVFGASTGAVEEKATRAELAVIDRGRYHQVKFVLGSPSHATLDVVDINGNSVASLYRGISGEGTVDWATGALPNGLYLCRLSSAEGVVTKKVIITR